MRADIARAFDQKEGGMTMLITQSPWYAELDHASQTGTTEPCLLDGEYGPDEPIEARAERLRKLNAEAFGLIADLIRRVFP